MGLKKSSTPPQGYVDCTVYPLEGIWDISEEAKTLRPNTFSKDDLVYKIMNRQPDFIDENIFKNALKICIAKNDNPWLTNIELEQIEDGPCLQMLHIGPFDEEPQSFLKMEQYAQSHNIKRVSKKHREIYLSDFRKVSPEKLKTVLRFQVGLTNKTRLQ